MDMPKEKLSDTLEIEADVENKNFQSHLIRIVSIPIFLIFLLLAYFHFQNEYRNTVDEEIKLFESALFDSVLLEKNFSDMATSIRGYIISGRPKLLTPFKKAERKIDGLQESIYKAINGHYDLSRSFRSVDNSLKKWVEDSKSVVENMGKSSQGVDPVTEDMLSQTDGQLNQLRDRIQSFKIMVKNKRAEARERLARVIQYTVALEIVFTIIFALFIAYLMTRQLKKLTSSYRTLLQQRLASMRQLEEASRAKDHFLANMSHEIRTPLGAIMGFAELVSEKNTLDAETRSHVVFIKRNSQHLLGLIDDLFDLSRVSAEKLEIFLEETDLKDLVRDIENIFSSKVLDKKINFNLRFDTKIPRMIVTDQVRLTQILSNLVSNAIKFSPNKSRIDVIFSFKGVVLIVDVIDQGIGIAPELQKTIFESFSQADVKHSREYGGAGLGLSISRKLAEILDGQLQLVDSTLSVGSHFQLRLPLKTFGDEFFDQKSWKAENNFNDIEVTQIKDKVDLTGKNVLLVEDSRENQILFKIFIESSKANLTIVDNGSEAVRKAMSDDFDLILMDIQMPGIDGYEALRILRSSSYDKKIIALTAHTMKGEKEKCLAAGFDGYLSKPISQNKLLLTMKQSIQDI